MGKVDHFPQEVSHKFLLLSEKWWATLWRHDLDHLVSTGKLFRSFSKTWNMSSFFPPLFFINIVLDYVLFFFFFSLLTYLPYKKPVVHGAISFGQSYKKCSQLASCHYKYLFTSEKKGTSLTSCRPKLIRLPRARTALGDKVHQGKCVTPPSSLTLTVHKCSTKIYLL